MENVFHKISRITSTAVTAKRFGNLAADGTLAICNASGENVAGVIYDTVSTGRSAALVVEAFPVEVDCAGTVTAGEVVQTDANGKAITQVSGKPAGLALTTATNGVIEIWLFPTAFATQAAVTDSSTGTAGTTVAAGTGVYNLVFQFDLADIADGDLVTDWIVGHKFKVLENYFFASEPVTTAAKATTLSIDIGATIITNSSIALTSANCTPAGAKVDNAGVLAANTGSATDTLTIKAATTTAFVEGKGFLVVRIQNMDTADAVASIVSYLKKAGVVA